MLFGTSSGAVSADPGSFGFDQTCNQMHDSISEIPVIGGILGDEVSIACKGGNVITHPDQAVAAVKDKAWDTTFGSVVESLLSGLGQALTMALVWWTKIPNAKLLDEQSLWQRISQYTNDIQVYLLAASVMVGAVRIAIARHHAHAEEAGEMVRVLARSVFAVWTAGAIVFAAARAGDSFSAWVIRDATHGNAKGMAEFLVQTSAYTAFSPGLVLILACVGILGALAMAVMAILRQALLVVAMSLLPLAAAGSGLGSGKQAHDRLWAWVVAFLLWKPIAALVYMVAFSTIDTGPGMDASAPMDADTAQRRLVGLVLLCCTVFVLPALMRLVSPLVAAAGSGGSGAAAAGAMLAAGSAVASGGKTLIARGASATAARAGSRTGSGGSATGHAATQSATSGGTPHGTSQRSTSTGGGNSTGQAATPVGAAPAGTRTDSKNSGTRSASATTAQPGAATTRPTIPAPPPRPGGDIPV
ncbi:hypothetical protein D5S18_07925 [Nocardia panacis]|uniref:Type IV secretion system protein n=1 Tax=Nocardia panacis TaxID=2340916 RepID=A0A3A4K0Q8_9NOCA|nr:hypothetical protein D5S18_07925 [Nocardia panacis]